MIPPRQTSETVSPSMFQAVSTRGRDRARSRARLKQKLKQKPKRKLERKQGKELKVEHRVLLCCPSLPVLTPSAVNSDPEL